MMYSNSADSRVQLLQKIDEAGFAVKDIQLYLDTHPCDEEALCYYRERIAERKCMMAEYAQNYGPLTIDDAAEYCGGTWAWAEQPFPWEQEGGCR